MSAISVMLEKHRAHLISDTAATRNGRLLGHCVKTCPVPHLDAAIAIRGNTKSVRTIAHLCAEYDDVDQMRAQIPIRLRAYGGLLAKWWPLRYGFDLFVAGVRDGKAFAWNLSSRTGYQFVDVEGFGAAPGEADMASDFEAAIDGFDTDKRDGFTSKLDAAACRVLDLQRKRWPGTIGGFGQITTVSRAGIVTRVIKRWPDKLGAPLAS